MFCGQRQQDGFRLRTTDVYGVPYLKYKIYTQKEQTTW